MSKCGMNKTGNNNNNNNNLHTMEHCPLCRYSFIAGYDTENLRKCPSCDQQFISSAKTRGANNVYYRDGCPALMNDARFITYYNSTNELTETMRKLNHIRSPNEFRTFMQNNADLFMNAERTYLERENTCSPTTACSEGWYNLWTKNRGNWANITDAPKPSNL